MENEDNLPMPNPDEIPRKLIRSSVVYEMELVYHKPKPIDVFQVTRQELDSINDLTIRRDILVALFFWLMGVVSTLVPIIFLNQFPDPMTHFAFIILAAVWIFFSLFTGCFCYFAIKESVKLNKKIVHAL
jgi:hypothetical protein